MSEKLTTFTVFGALLLGYPLGAVLLRFAANNRLLARTGALAGAVMSFVGIMGDGDIRYVILAEVGLYLQTVWLVASFRFKRANKAVYRELAFHDRAVPNSSHGCR
jgi:hypothetical protein